MSFKTVHPEYPDDLIHIDRWMCSNCGLIFDFIPTFEPGKPGHTDYDSAPEKIEVWLDKDGKFQVHESGWKEICPRCRTDLSEHPLQHIFVSKLMTLSDIKPIIERGEGEQTEFMVKFPESAHDLAKEIAAFASTQGGKIFLGVKDNSDIVGLKGISTPEEKDALTKRIRGLLGKITPKVDVSIDYVFYDAIHIAVITVRKGHMPLYDYEGKTYIRDLDESRSATPDEKIRLMTEWNIKNRQ